MLSILLFYLDNYYYSHSNISIMIINQELIITYINKIFVLHDINLLWLEFLFLYRLYYVYNKCMLSI